MTNKRVFFHVSRHGELPSEILMNKDYLEYALPDNAPIEDYELLEALKSYFPSGVSDHGRGYLTEPFNYIQDVSGRGYIPHIYTIELVFELVRRLNYPTSPSRYTSFYGYEALEDALAFRNSTGHSDCPIYKVESQGFFRADMNLLLMGQSSIHTLSFATRYWSGKESNNPIWEVLLTYPINIISRVE